MKLVFYCTPCTKTNSKWIKDLNVRPKTVKLLEENIWGKHIDVGLGDEFLDLTPKVKINKLDYIKYKDFCTAKETNEMKRQPLE